MSDSSNESPDVSSTATVGVNGGTATDSSSGSCSWGRRRLYAAGPDLDLEMTPIINNHTICNLSTSVQGAIIAVVMFFAGSLTQIWAYRQVEEGWQRVLVFLLGVLLNFLSLLLIFASYSRSHVWKCMKTFNFVYLSIQFGVYTAITAMQHVEFLDWYWTLFMIPNYGLMCAVTFGMDASHMPRIMKGVLMALGAFIYVVGTWMVFGGQETDDVSIPAFRTYNLGFIAQSCAVNLTLFNLRFAVQSLVFKEDIVMTVYNAKREERRDGVEEEEEDAESSQKKNAMEDGGSEDTEDDVKNEADVENEDDGKNPLHATEEATDDVDVSDLE